MQGDIRRNKDLLPRYKKKTKSIGKKSKYNKKSKRFVSNSMIKIIAYSFLLFLVYLFLRLNHHDLNKIPEYELESRRNVDEKGNKIVNSFNDGEPMNDIIVDTPIDSKEGPIDSPAGSNEKLIDSLQREAERIDDKTETSGKSDTKISADGIVDGLDDDDENSKNVKGDIAHIANEINENKQKQVKNMASNKIDDSSVKEVGNKVNQMDNAIDKNSKISKEKFNNEVAHQGETKNLENDLKPVVDKKLIQ